MEFYLIAEVKSVYGKEGFLILNSFSDFQNRFFKLKSAYIEFFGNMKKLDVRDVLETDKGIAIRFENFFSDDDAKILVGKKIFVDEKETVKLDKNSFFIHDLIGCSVTRNSLLLGIVEDVLVLPANDVYVVKDQSGKRILLPAVKDYILSVDIKKKLVKLVADCDLLYDED